MNWNKFPPNKPEDSGSYLVSITRKSSSSQEYTFTYKAFYDANTESWHKYNPWDDDNSKGDKISDKIIRWVSELAVFLG